MAREEGMATVEVDLAEGKEVVEESETSRRLGRLERLIEGLARNGGEERRKKKKGSRPADSSCNESDTDNESDSSEEETRRSKRKSKKRKKTEKKEKRRAERRAERLERAKKRQWRMPSHREQFAVIDEALDPIQRAKSRAIKEGSSKKLLADIEEGEKALLDRVKLILFADEKGWAAAKIYSRRLEVGSDSEDERKMRVAAAEALKETGARRPFRQRRAATDGQQPATQQAIRLKPMPAPASSRVADGRATDFECWSCGERGHVQRNCPRAQRLPGGGAPRAAELQQSHT